MLLCSCVLVGSLLFCCVLIGCSLYSCILIGCYYVQGVWLALLTTSGSLARVVGPLFVTDLYENYGTYVTFGLVTGCHANNFTM